MKVRQYNEVADKFVKTARATGGKAARLEALKAIIDVGGLL